MTKPKYVKIRGSGVSQRLSVIHNRSTVWRGDDHFLLVSNMGYTESYKRFYFRDIKAFIVQRTGRRILYGIVLFLFLALFLFLLANFPSAIWFWGPLAGITTLIMIVNHLKGPTCNSYIVTGVQKTLFPSMRRIPRTQKILTQLRPHIEESQGKVTTEELIRRADEIRSPAANLGDSIRTNSRIKSTPANRYKGSYHRLMSLLMLVMVILYGLDLLVNHVTILITALLFTMILICITAIALSKQADSRLGANIKMVTWISAVTQILETSTRYTVMTILMSFEDPEVINNQWLLLKAISEQNPSENIVVMICLVVPMLAYFVLAILGFILLNRFKKNESVPPPIPGAPS